MVWHRMFSLLKETIFHILRETLNKTFTATYKLHMMVFSPEHPK